MLGLMSLGISIPRAGRNVFTDLAGLGLFWQAGTLLLMAGAGLIGLSWLSSRREGASRD
jgi:hypothetical protein